MASNNSNTTVRRKPAPPPYIPPNPPTNSAPVDGAKEPHISFQYPQHGYQQAQNVPQGHQQVQHPLYGYQQAQNTPKGYQPSHQPHPSYCPPLETPPYRFPGNGGPEVFPELEIPIRGRMGPPPPPLSHMPSTMQYPPGPLPLTKTRPKQAGDSASQPPQTHPSPRSSSQPSPIGTRLHKIAPLQAGHLSPGSRSPARSPGGSPTPRGRERSNSLAPPGSFEGVSNRAVSSPNNPNHSSSAYHSDNSARGSPDGRSEKRRSWFGGGRSRASSKGESNNAGLVAWACTANGTVPYHVQLLVNGEKVPELWMESADTYVYLFPYSTGKGPSFKIPSTAIASSTHLIASPFSTGRQRARSFDGRHSLTAEDARNITSRNLNTPPPTPRTSVRDNPSDRFSESFSSLGDSTTQGHILYPFASTSVTQAGHTTAQSDVDRLVSARNLFAFLTCQPLVATRQTSTPFKILCNIASHLGRLGFSNTDGSTFGETAAACFDFFVENLNLADVSGSREKTIEAVVLGERMRSTTLYNEAFAHAVGKYDSTRQLDLPIWSMISENTRIRLERAHTDLERRKKLINIRLSDCEFPSLFAGIAASTSSEESKLVNFKAWKSSFSCMRRFLLNYYKNLHGNWPPKASSKKNAFSEPGFNRLVLKLLYNDLCDLYDLLVDRQNPTSRSLQTDQVPEAVEGSMCVTALRKMLSEYDRSEPPVQPPVPFDVPLIPVITTIDANHLRHPLHIQDEANNRRLKEYQANLLLLKARNFTSQKKTDFLRAFNEFEAKEARGRTAQELADQRYGQWLFLYAVLQALPMLVIDAPDCHHTSSIEYFLCVGAQGSPPWIEEGPQMNFYRIGETGATVALPASAIANSPEGIYRRSHCWLMSYNWLNELVLSDEEGCPSFDDSQNIDSALSPLETPAPPFAAETSRPTSTGNAGSAESGTLYVPRERSSRSKSREAHRRSLAFPLEQLSAPPDLFRTPPRASPPIAVAGASEGGFFNAASAQGRRSSDNSGSHETVGKTFDDILSSMEDDKEKKRGRMSFFGGR